MKEHLSARLKILHDLTDPRFTLGKEVNVEATIVPRLDIPIETIKFKLIIYVDTDSEEEILLDIQTLDKARILKAGETYTYYFSVKNDKMNTYYGKHVNYIPKLYLIVNKQEYENKSAIKKIKEWMSPPDNVVAVRDLPFKVRYTNFIFPNSITTFNFNLGTISAMPFTFFIAFLFVKDYEAPLFYLTIFSVALVLLFGVYYFIGKYLVKDILFQIERKASDLLEVKLSNEDNWGYVHKVIVNYIIEEKATIRDNDGDHEVSHTLFKSPIKDINDVSKPELITKFRFDEKHPLFIETKNTSINWIFKLKVITPLRIPLFYKCIIKPHFQYSRG